MVPVLWRGQAAPGRSRAGRAADQLVSAGVVQPGVVEPAVVVESPVVEPAIFDAPVVDPAVLDAAIEFALVVVAVVQRHPVEVTVGEFEGAVVEFAGGSEAVEFEQRWGVGEFGPVAARLRGSRSGGLGGGHGWA